MINLSTGDNVMHSQYGEVELHGFISVSDEIEINEIERDNETILDVVSSVNGDRVEFLDSDGKKYAEPLDVFCEQAEL